MSRGPKKKAAETTPYYASEELYQTLFEQAADGIFIADPQGRYIEVNRRGCEMLRYTREEMLDLSPEDLIPAEELAAEPLRLADLRAGKIVLSERRLRCKDDRALPVEISARILADGNFLWLVRDISERKQAEAALRKSEEELRAFFSQAIDGCFFMMLDDPVCWDDTVDKEQVLDYVFAHQRITQINEAMLAQYGATREQILNLTPADFFEHDLAHGRDLWRRFFDAGRLSLESNERKMDGTSMWIEGEYIALYDSAGRITGHFGIQREITERKQAEEKISRQLDELQRWHEVTLNREERIQELKREVNRLCAQLGEPIRYPSQEG